MVKGIKHPLKNSHLKSIVAVLIQEDIFLNARRFSSQGFTKPELHL